jgi:hypothetical protein
MDISLMKFDVPLGVDIVRAPDSQTERWGLVSTREWRKGHKLGVVKGEYITVEEYEDRYPEGKSVGKAWKVCVDKEVMYLDTSDAFNSNWARFLLPCPNGRLPNISVVENKGRVGVFTSEIVKAGEFLYVSRTSGTEEPGVVAPPLVRAEAKRPIRVPLPVDDDEDLRLNGVNLDPATDTTASVVESKQAATVQLEDLKVGDFVIFRDPDGDRVWMLGRITAIDSDEQGTFVLRYYGTYDVARPLAKRRFKPAWHHERGNTLTFESTCRAAHTAPFEYRVDAEDIILGKVIFQAKSRTLMLSKITCDALRDKLSHVFFAVMPAYVTNNVTTGGL